MYKLKYKPRALKFRKKWKLITKMENSGKLNNLNNIKKKKNNDLKSLCT